MIDQIGNVFVAVNHTTRMIEHLQTYYKAQVESLIAASVAESAACAAGLSALIRAIEEKVLEGLNSGIRLFFGQVIHPPIPYVIN